MHAPRGRGRERGMSLIEVTVATLLLAMIAVTLGQSIVRGHQHGKSLEDARRVRVVCQSVLMDVAESPWGTAGTAGTIEFLRANGPVAFRIDGFADERGTITVTDVSAAFPERTIPGKVYRITVRFGGQVFHSYVDNVA